MVVVVVVVVVVLVVVVVVVVVAAAVVVVLVVVDVFVCSWLPASDLPILGQEFDVLLVDFDVISTPTK